MLSRILIASSFLLSMSLTSVAAFAGDLENAQNLKAGIQKAQQVVDRVIDSVGPQASLHDVGLDDLGLGENDALALPALMQASSSLFRAGQNVDESILYFLSGNVPFGLYKFSMGCMSTGLARSQIARANVAALQPPAGFVTAFSIDLISVVNELFLLRSAVSCP